MDKSMIYGIDFTSTPTVRKPITCAHATLTDERLTIKHIEHRIRRRDLAE